MRPSRSFFRGFLGLHIVGVLMLLASCSLSPEAAPPNVQDVPLEGGSAQVEASVIITEAVDPLATPATTALDGPGIIQSRCVQCHPADWVEQIEKPRTEWEAALAQMEGFGVHLSEAEKDALIDYLAIAGES